GVGANFVTIGTMQEIEWENGSKFLKIDYDPTNTFTFNLTLGTIEFVSVPYAFAAETVVFIDATGAENGDVLVYNEATGKFEPGTATAGSVTWDNVQDKPNFATVATSGSYNDLTDVPQIDGSETTIIAGSNVTVTGSGTTGDPYIVTATGGGASLLPPTVSVTAASDVQIITAQLNGVVNPNGLSTTVVFEYGLTSSYGSTVNAVETPVTGTANANVSKPLTGLIGNTTYHYRVKATNAVNVAYSSDMTFTTTFPLIPTVTTSEYSDVKGNSAKAGGAVTNNGGSAVTAQGLCWSTTPNPTTANNTTTSFTAVMASLSPNTTYYVRAYATNIAGTGYGNEISFNSGRLIGSSYAGGLVFYNDGAGHGLVCAESDQSTGAEWGCYGTAIGGTSTAINTGAANTNAIVAGCSTAGIAAKLCYDLSLNTYTDWYLPSKDELGLMYTNLHTQSLGNFAAERYWSSSECSGNEAYGAWKQNFSDGSQYNSYKYSTGYVRAVRAF
ncbi:MAG: DUF1566 domain-containing protein, partial [Clostridia bacterium]|nr:DUF1566 domain-containing protein [Clostridia bacterium]